MLVAVVFVVVAVAVFARCAPRLGHAAHPRVATYLLAAGAVAATTAVLGSLALVAATAVAQLRWVADLGDWNPETLRSEDPVPVWLALCCAGLLIPPAVLLAAHLARRTRGYLRLQRSCRTLRRGGAVSTGRLVLVDTGVAAAFATPVDGGRVVVTSGLMDRLSEADQRVLLAHEAAHLRHGHCWWVLAVDLCAAVNPWLRPVARTIRHTVERWADECAARAVGDRRLAAHALARAALHITEASRDAAGALSAAAVGGEVPRRVRALLAPPPRRRPAAVAILLLLVLATLLCLLAVQQRTDLFFDSAGIDYSAVDLPPLAPAGGPALDA